MIKFISNSDHYSSILSHCKDVKHTLWIGTADIKDAYIDIKGEKTPFLKLMAQLIRKGVDIRLVHAKEPGPAFRDEVWIGNKCKNCKRREFCSDPIA